MKVEGNTIILDAGEEVTIKAMEKDVPVPVPSPDDSGDDSPKEQTVERLTTEQLISKFNVVLKSTGHKPMTDSMDVTGHMKWASMFAGREFDNPDSEFFKPENYPEVCDYHGKNESTLNLVYNAMRAWLFAMSLSEICPTSGKTTNT